MNKELKAGVIGLGAIGGGVATSLINRDRIPVVYDVIPDAYKKHLGVPKQLDSPAAVAEASDVIMIAVFNSEQVKETLTGKNGLLRKAHQGMVIVVLSTISVKKMKEFAALCAKKNVGFLDCGVTPGSLASQNGLVTMVGGDKETVDYALPVLEDWSANVIHCGAVGSGIATKIARNVNTFGVWRIIAESTRLAIAAGITADKYLEALKIADRQENLFYSFLSQCTTAPDGKLPRDIAEIFPKFMTKDLDASIDLSNDLGVDMPVRDAVYNLIEDTCDLV